MIFFPNAKINLGLNVISKKNNGYHNLESCFCPINLFDIIEIKKSDSSSFRTSGIKIPGKSKENIIFKIIKEIKTKVKPLDIFLYKNIPLGSGLGGGSSNATFSLLTINKLLNLKIKKNELFRITKKVGSDCPFFINNEVSYVQGTGNIIEKINIDIYNKKIIIIIPNLHISTKEAFKKISINKPKYSIKTILENESIEKWEKYIFNDFENYTFFKYNFLKKIKESLYNYGALFSSLSGTGSAIYGIFNKDVTIDENKFKNCSLIEAKVLKNASSLELLN
tara:strand:- start:1366 stop:2205 length:840 start_codon:yes stop_codon:yes gene_type:complete